MNYLKKTETYKNYNFINDTLFAQGNEHKICENELKKIDEIVDQIFLIKKNQREELNSLFSNLEYYSNIVFENLFIVNKDQYFQLFIEEIKIKYFDTLNEIKLKICSKNFSESYDKNNALFTKGYYFGELKKEAVESIINISKKYLNIFSENIKKNKTNRNDLSVNTGSDIRKIIKIINFQFDKNGINNCVSDYMRKTSEVVGCSLEMSTENSTWWRWDNLL